MTDQLAHAQDYHWETSYIRHWITGHPLDSDHCPVPYKACGYIKILDIRNRELGQYPGLRDLFSPPYKNQGKQPLDRDALSAVLLHAYAVWQSVRSGRTQFFLRTGPSAGGLYPCHLYLLIQGVDGFETGVYYCALIHHVREMIQQLDAGRMSVRESGIFFIVTAQFYNSAWNS
jgi:hypothetical protein